MKNRFSILPEKTIRIVLFICLLAGALAGAAGCRPTTATPTRAATATPQQTLTPTIQATLTPSTQPVFRTFALGQVLPDMRVPAQRGAGGEGGWYVIIGSQEGWAQFLSQMGQPAFIWQSVDWEQEILVGALLGLRQGQQQIEIVDVVSSGVGVQFVVETAAPAEEQPAAGWTTYPFHLIGVPRIELPLGPATFRFATPDSSELGSQIADASDIDIVWLNGAPAVFPTPPPAGATPTPPPEPTPTPVPNTQVRCIILDVQPEGRAIHVVAETGAWQVVDLMEGTSILLQDGQPTTLGQLLPGMTIGVLGYPGEEQNIRAAHIDVLKPPAGGTVFAVVPTRSAAPSTIYSGYDLPLSLDTIQSPDALASTFSISQTEALTRSGFVIRPAGYQNFTDLYTDARFTDYPLFISSDSALHVTQILFEHTRRAVEQTHLGPELERLDRAMFELSWTQYLAVAPLKSVDAQTVADAALQNAAYFAVALALLDDEFSPPEILSSTVGAELALIRAAEGSAISPLFEGVQLATPITDSEKLHIDYARFAPHMATTRYAQAFTWHEQTDWQLARPQEALSIALLVHTLNQNNVPHMLWARIFSARQFFNGLSHTLTPGDLLETYRQIWGAAPNLTDLADPLKLAAFASAGETLAPAPAALAWLGQPLDAGGAIMASSIQSEEMTTTLALSAVHLGAALNGPEAYSVVAELGNSSYITTLDRINSELNVLAPEAWTLTGGWIRLGIYRTMIQDKTTAYPQWMRSRGWRRKDLQTALAHWVDSQRAAPPVAAPRPEMTATSTALWGYVEPQPQVYNQLAAWMQMLIDGLDSRLMLPGAEKSMLVEWQSWLALLQDVARRELTGQTLTDLEFQRLAGYGAAISKLTTPTLQDLPLDAPADLGYDLSAHTILTQDRDTAKIAAIGRVDEIFVVVERAQQRFLTRGGVYSFYEFEWPLEALLEGEALSEREALPRPEWLGEIVLP